MKLLLLIFLLANSIIAQDIVRGNVLIDISNCSNVGNFTISKPLIFCTGDNKIYFYNGSTWVAYGGGGGAVDSVNGQTGIVVLTKSNIDLGNVDNTSDANKPISTATQTALDNKVTANGAITGNTHIKITYDAKGLVTSGANATTADINDSSNRRYVTDSNLTVINNTSGVNTGDQTSVTGNAGTATALQTARNINGVPFDGTANVTIPTAFGYTLNVQALTSSPADAATIFFGQLPKAPVTTGANSKIFIRKAGAIKIANIYCFSGTAGTAESWSLFIRVNNTTDTLIAAVALGTSERVFVNTSLNITVNVGDYFEIKSVNPTWVTNPLTTIFGGYVYIE